MISGAEKEKFFYRLDIKRWTEIKKYGKISIRNDAMKSGVDGEYLL